MPRKTNTPKVDGHYVNNKTLLEHLIDYKKRKKENTNATIDGYTAKAIMSIAERFSLRPNFSGYTFREDMVSDAVENVIRYIDNFNPEKSKNPFAYITQICYYAFIRRISDEKVHTYLRFKSMQKFFENNELADMQDMDDSGSFQMDNPLYDNMEEFIDNFELEVEENRKKSKKYNQKMNKKRKNDDNSSIEFED